METIERQAEAVLAGVPPWIWDGDSLPVPIADIADTRYGLLIRDVGDLSVAPGVPPLGPGQTLSGLLVADRGEIWVNAEEAERWPPRRRFTIGHELGHFCLHHSHGQTVYCRAASVDETAGLAAARPPLPATEGEANAFAAAQQAASGPFIRDTNPIESSFATVKLRTRVTKGAGSKAAALGMAFKLLKAAEERWRRFNGHELVADVLAGATFKDGIRVPDEHLTHDEKVAA